MTRLNDSFWLTMFLVAFYLSSTTIGGGGGEGNSLMTSFTLEVYWESYMTFPNDAKTCKSKESRSNWIPNGKLKRRSASTIPFGFDLTSIPDLGVNVISIAFADFNVDRCDRYLECNEIVCGLNMFKGLDEPIFEKLLQDIKQVQSKGTIVKLAFGGEQWGNIKVPTRTTHVADRLVDLIVESSQRLGVDGVDLVQEEGCGWKNFRCQDQTSVHLYVIENLRKRIPDKIISYTFPVTGSYPVVNFPFNDVIKYGHGFLDSINIFGAKTNETIWKAIEAGVPKEKIVWGLSIGCNEPPFHNVTPAEAETASRFVREIGLKGISIWSINRDTNRRTIPNNVCTHEQTGIADGSYVAAVDKILH